MFMKCQRTSLEWCTLNIRKEEITMQCTSLIWRSQKIEDAFSIWQYFIRSNDESCESLQIGRQNFYSMQRSVKVIEDTHFSSSIGTEENPVQPSMEAARRSPFRDDLYLSPSTRRFRSTDGGRRRLKRSQIQSLLMSAERLHSSNHKWSRESWGGTQQQCGVSRHSRQRDEERPSRCFLRRLWSRK